MKVIQPLPKTSSNYSVQPHKNGIQFTFGNTKKDIRIMSWVLIVVLIVLPIFLNYKYHRVDLPFMLFWSVICAFSFYWLWLINIKETVEVDNTGIKVTSIDLLGRTQINQFLFKDIHDLRVFQNLGYARYAKNPLPASGRMTLTGPLGFQYGGGTYYFGMGILGEEAEEVLTLIQEKFPNYTVSENRSSHVS